MSLEFYYSDRNTIVVTCGGVCTELPLLALPPGSKLTVPATSSSSPAQPQISPKAPDPQTRKSVPEPTEEPTTDKNPRHTRPRPGEGPGLMIIRPTGHGSRDSISTDDLFASMDYDFEVPSIDLDILRSLDSSQKSGIVGAARKALGHTPTITVLDVRVTPEQLKKGINAIEFQPLFEQNGAGFDVVRLFLANKFDPSDL
jgi:hypothetical protein